MDEIKKIIHIDMDAFYASVEQRDNPKLKGLPLVVCRDLPRSVVTTASYEARKYGIHSAMSLAQAKNRCPNLVIVEPHFQKYKRSHNKFITFFINILIWLNQFR